jgi:SAM-dependent methyltransferase
MAEARVDTVRLQNLAQAYGQSAALMAAVELGFFTAVSKGAGSFAELAQALDIHPANAERLAVMLTAMALLEQRDGRLRNAADVERFLVEGSPSYAGPWMLFTKPNWNAWGRLAEHLRVKELKLLGSIETFTVDDARRYHQATYSIGLGAGRRFVRQVDLSKRQAIIDIGGGSGAYCIAAAKAHPQIRGTVLDLAPVVTVAREFIAENGVADRVSAQVCDFTRDPFPPGDVAIMASNLPMYGRETISAVIKKAFDALAPGGEMHLIGETTDDARSGPIGPAFWGLGQAIQDSLGLAHSGADCIGYFQAAGFTEVAVNPFIEGSLSRVSGRKPG